MTTLFEVAVIGAGISGLGTAIKLREAGQYLSGVCGRHPLDRLLVFLCTPR